MKRITQLFLIVLALTAASLAAAPQKGGSRIHSKATGYGYYCYDTPGTIEDCGTLSSCACRAACEYDCEGACDWDGSCQD
jgi:hypothetical protein